MEIGLEYEKYEMGAAFAEMESRLKEGAVDRIGSESKLTEAG